MQPEVPLREKMQIQRRQYKELDTGIDVMESNCSNRLAHYASGVIRPWTCQLKVSWNVGREHRRGEDMEVIGQ